MLPTTIEPARVSQITLHNHYLIMFSSVQCKDITLSQSTNKCIHSISYEAYPFSACTNIGYQVLILLSLENLGMKLATLHSPALVLWL